MLSVAWCVLCVVCCLVVVVWRLLFGVGCSFFCCVLFRCVLLFVAGCVAVVGVRYSLFVGMR